MLTSNGACEPFIEQHLQRVLQRQHAKAWALRGSGLSIISQDFTEDLEIVILRSRLNTRPTVERIWGALSGG